MTSPAFNRAHLLEPSILERRPGSTGDNQSGGLERSAHRLLAVSLRDLPDDEVLRLGPSFVHLLPYAVTLASKLAFGLAAAATLRALPVLGMAAQNHRLQ